MNILSFIASLFRSEKATSSEVLKILNEGAALAVSDARHYNYKLDYSDESIKNVDRVLLKVRKDYIGSNHRAELKNFALVFGLYVIEVFERNHGKGYLERRLAGLSDDSFPYYRKGELLFPYLWCLSKLTEDEAEDVRLKYNSYK